MIWVLIPYERTALVTLEEKSEIYALSLLFLLFCNKLNWRSLSYNLIKKTFVILYHGSGSGFGEWYGRLINFLHP